jgi:hypothetical protein
MELRDLLRNYQVYIDTSALMNTDRLQLLVDNIEKDITLRKKIIILANVYQELWNNQSEQIFTALIDYLNSFTPEEAAAINASRLLDAQRWEYDAVTLEDNTKEAVTWFTKRQQWMNEQFMTKVTAQRFVDTANSTVYSLTGQKIRNPNTLKPGIYISKGKKFVVK